MKNVMRILVSFILCLAMLLSMTSCDLVSELIGGLIEDQSDGESASEPETGGFEAPLDGCDHCDLVPEGYTAGFALTACMHETIGYYWLETYDEVLEAIELLKSHGSQIDSCYGVTCDGEPYDIKWCFSYLRRDAEELEEGKSFFDRRIDGGQFTCYILRKDVTIEELIFSYIRRYDYLYFSKAISCVEIEDPEQLYVDWWGRETYGIEYPELEYYIMYGDTMIATLGFPIGTSKEDLLTDEYLEILFDSLVLIG